MPATGRFRRSDRLLRPRDFQRVGRSGRRDASPYFVVLVDGPVAGAETSAGGRPSRGSRDPDPDPDPAPAVQRLGNTPSRRTVQRLGITASRKVGNAVVRNRIKRAVREWFRSERQSLCGPLDIVVIARRAAADLRSPEVAGILHDQLRRALGSPEQRA